MPVSNQNQVRQHLCVLIARLSVGLRPPRAAITIDDYREELRQALRAVPDNSWWIHVCLAPTGTGKTVAQIALLEHLITKGNTSVTFAPTHQNCGEIVAMRRAAGISSTAFPLLDETTCRRYAEAESVNALGLSPVAVLCPDCPYREGCPHDEQYRAAMESPHKVATLSRGRVSLPMLTRGTDCVILDEDPTEMLAPRYTLSEYPRAPGEPLLIDREHPLRVVARIADQAAALAANPNDRGFYRHLASVALYLDRQHHAAFETVEVELPAACKHTPRSLQRDLHQAVCLLGIERFQRPPADALRISVLATQGQLRLLAVARNESLSKSSVRRFYNVLTGIGGSQLPITPTVICDATADLGEIRTLTGGIRPIRDIAPRGVLPTLKPVLQVIPRYEVTRSRLMERTADDLRGIIHDLPQYPRVGLMTHKTHHEKVCAALGEPYASRITMVGYYGDGLSRGSNEWIERCDVLVLLGWPRPGSTSIREYLIGVGKVRAANLTEEQADWHQATWVGTTESGQSVEVTTGRYRNEDWHQAYCAITHRQIKQAIGRGRGILPEGIPVYVVTTEEVGALRWGHGMKERLGDPTAIDVQAPIPILDEWFLPLTLEHIRLLDVLRALGATSRSRAVKRGEICRRLYGAVSDKATRQVKYQLDQLWRAERIQRRGERHGWYLPLQR